MTKGVRIYAHDDRIHHRPRGEPAKRLAVRSNWISWIGVFNRFKNSGARLVAVGCEEGAMVAHFRVHGR
jgi:hypothetical protein